MGYISSLKNSLKKTILGKADRITVYSDAQMAIKQLRETKSKKGQTLKIQIYEQAKQLWVYGREVIVKCIPSHSGIKRK